MRRIRAILEMQSLLKDAETIYYYHKDAKKAITLGDRAIAIYEGDKELSEISDAKDLYKKLLNFVGEIYADLRDEMFKSYMDRFFQTY